MLRVTVLPVPVLSERGIEHRSELSLDFPFLPQRLTLGFLIPCTLHCILLVASRIHHAVPACSTFCPLVSCGNAWGVNLTVLPNGLKQWSRGLFVGASAVLCHTSITITKCNDNFRASVSQALQAEHCTNKVSINHGRVQGHTQQGQGLRYSETQDHHGAPLTHTVQWGPIGPVWLWGLTMPPVHSRQCCRQLMVSHVL